jgi:wyosine [tRNA(Phe)-imidazoG37] synthetase (radical SAM superfamily)
MKPVIPVQKMGSSLTTRVYRERWVLSNAPGGRPWTEPLGEGLWCYSFFMGDSPLTISRHSRSHEGNRYVYAVLSRRSRGISVGINLNPDKICNFDCVYCQVDRVSPPALRDVDEAVLEKELESILVQASDGSLFSSPSFRGVPDPLRRLADVAFAGDGEPTTYPRFREVVARVIGLKKKLGLEGLKIAVLTNATVLDRPAVRDALALLDESDGEIWAKLDAGTEAYYEEVCVPGGSRFSRILANILDAARVRPVVIQSLFLRLEDRPPPEAEIDAFCDRLREISAAGGRIRLVQVYTVARRPAKSTVSPLADAEVSAIAERVKTRTGLKVEAYPGSSDW